MFLSIILVTEELTTPLIVTNCLFLFTKFSKKVSFTVNIKNRTISKIFIKIILVFQNVQWNIYNVYNIAKFI